MRKVFGFVLTSVMVLSLTACGAKKEEVKETATPTPVESTVVESTQEQEQVQEQEQAQDPETIKIKAYNAAKEEVEIEVPYNPDRIAVMDLATMDILDNLGFGDRIVAASKGSAIDYLQKYISNDDIINLGTIKEADLEAVMESEPDVIFIGGRLSASYDALSEIAPVVFLATDIEIGLVESVEKNALTIASMFGAQDQVNTMLADFDARIEALAAVAKDKTAFIGMLNAGALNVLGNDGRCSLIGVEVGFENIGVGVEKGESKEGSSEATVTSAHGNETSFEFITRLNPDYIFVMNRDEAVGTEGAQPAKEVVENELIMKTDAYKNGNIVYLEHPGVWYTAEGGITALDYMLKDLETALLNK